MIQKKVSFLIVFLALLTSSTMFVSCKPNCDCPDDNKTIPEPEKEKPLTLADLQTTVWKGTYVSRGDEGHPISVSFYDDKRGEYIFLNKDDNVAEHFKIGCDFKYTTSQEKLISIRPSDKTYLFGNLEDEWWVIEYTKETLILATDIAKPISGQRQLILKKVTIEK